MYHAYALSFKIDWVVEISWSHPRIRLHQNQLRQLTYSVHIFIPFSAFYMRPSKSPSIPDNMGTDFRIILVTLTVSMDVRLIALQKHLRDLQRLSKQCCTMCSSCGGFTIATWSTVFNRQEQSIRLLSEQFHHDLINFTTTSVIQLKSKAAISLNQTIRVSLKPYCIVVESRSNFLNELFVSDHHTLRRTWCTLAPGDIILVNALLFQSARTISFVDNVED